MPWEKQVIIRAQGQTIPECDLMAMNFLMKGDK